MGFAPSTYAPPFNDASEGVRGAITMLQEVTGRQMISMEESLITPGTNEGTGVDMVAATISATPALKVLAVGLLEDVSLESARNLASTIYSRVVDTISMNDRRALPEKVDEILRQRPDLVIIAGGTENGASKSVIKLLDPVGLASYLMPQGQRPRILFAGNPEVTQEVRATLGEFGTVHTAPNLRPALDAEQLGPAQGELRSMYRKIFAERNPGVRELDAWTGGRLLPSAAGFGRLVRFISQDSAAKPVLGVDVGAASTVVASAYRGDLRQRIYARLGMGEALENLFRHTTFANVARWLAIETSEADVRDYVLHKSFHPNSIPMTDEDAAIELALARELLRAAMKDASRHFPARAPEIRSGLMPLFEPIIVSGSTFTRAANPGYSLLALLDGLEPVGVSVVLMDEHALLPALGAAAEVNSVLPVQVLDSGVLRSLGTVIAPVSGARFGTPILRLKATLPSGEEKRLDIKEGMLTTIPLEPNQKAEIQLQPLNRCDVGLGGPGRGGSVKVVGGELGIVIDARGRALTLSAEPSRRKDLIKKWLWTLGN
jgi:uncharacterized protein (TIGR01319 family)